MKKITSLTLVLLFALVMTLAVGCGGNNTAANSTPPAGDSRGEETASDYSGLWQASPVVGSGYSERLALNADGTFFWAESQMNGLSRERFSSGTWSVTNGVLTLAVAERLVWEGGTVENNPILGGDALVDTHMVVAQQSDTLTYQLSDVTTDSGANNKLTFTANGTQYWQLPAEPDSLRKDYEDARALA